VSKGLSGTAVLTAETWRPPRDPPLIFIAPGGTLIGSTANARVVE
jgi:hypothetical protein